MRRAFPLVLVLTLAACGPDAPAPVPAAQVAPVEPSVAVSVPPWVVTRPGVREPSEELVAFVRSNEIGMVSDAARGSGDCALRLRLRNADDGSSVAMYARLWRLGVDGDDAWSDGDHVQARLTIGTDGATVDHLPAGSYRVEVRDERASGEDPPEFVVEGATTECVLDIRPRRAHRVRLQVFGEDGSLVRRVTGRITKIEGSNPGLALPPSWANTRVLNAAPRDAYPLPPGRPTNCFPKRPTFPELVGGPDGFDLGTLREASRSDAPAVHAEVQSAGRNDVEAMADSRIVEDSTLVAVCIPNETLAAHVVRPDGTAVPVSEVSISSAVCRAIAGPWEPKRDVWRDEIVRVIAEVAGFETLAYDWSAATSDVLHALAERRSK
jgi:hypothetical protein